MAGWKTDGNTLLLMSHLPQISEPPQAIVRSMMVEPARVPTPTLTCKVKFLLDSVLACFFSYNCDDGGEDA